jgi:hypothetical protein
MCLYHPATPGAPEGIVFAGKFLRHVTRGPSREPPSRLFFCHSLPKWQ